MTAKYRFYGWETADIKDKYGLTPIDYYDLLSEIWQADTCAPRMRGDWSPENRTLGQCSITAFLMQDQFGGKVYGVPLKGGNYHCFNVVGDCVFDLTSEQFGGVRLNYTNCPEQFRDVHFAKEEKRQRYELLKARLIDRLPKLIETGRLILRPFVESDAADVYEYLKEPAVNCFASMKLHSLDEARKEMKKRAGETEYYFAIVLKENGKVIGEICAYPEAGEQHEGENGQKDTFSPCWMLNLNYTGQGYAYEAAHAFFDYLFGEKGARRIYAYTEDTNVPSQRLCERLGMRREGLFMEFISFVNNPDGTPRYENTYQYAILKKEWHTDTDLKKAVTPDSCTPGDLCRRS